MDLTIEKFKYILKKLSLAYLHNIKNILKWKFKEYNKTQSSIVTYRLKINLHLLYYKLILVSKNDLLAILIHEKNLDIKNYIVLNVKKFIYFFI